MSTPRLTHVGNQMSAKAPETWIEFEFQKEWEVGIKAGCCGLCGNSGFIDTRKSARTPTGNLAGVLAYCICPNGRRNKRRVGHKKWGTTSIMDAPEAVDE